MSRHNKKTFELNALTTIDNLAKQILAAQEISRRAIPPPVPELMLTLADRQIGALHQGRIDSGIFAHQSALLASQRGVHDFVHDARRQWRHVVWFAGFRNAPAESG